MRYETKYEHTIDFGKETLKTVFNEREKSLIEDVQQGLSGPYKIKKPFEWFWGYRGVVSRGPGYEYNIKINPHMSHALVCIEHSKVKNDSVALEHVDEIEKIITGILEK